MKKLPDDKQFAANIRKVIDGTIKTEVTTGRTTLPPTRVIKRCKECLSDQVVVDATVVWNVEKQAWEINEVSEKDAVCADCEGPCRTVDHPIQEKRPKVSISKRLMLVGPPQELIDFYARQLYEDYKVILGEQLKLHKDAVKQEQAIKEADALQKKWGRLRKKRGALERKNHVGK